MKRLAIVAAVLLVLAGAGAWIAYHYVDVIVKVALERYGPDVTGVPVTVGDVRISPYDGAGRVRALELANPAGFSAGRALRIGQVRIVLDPATVMRDVVLVRELVVEGVQLTYERGGKATNLDVIQKHIEAYAKRSEATAPAKAAPREDKVRFVVERLAIRRATVLMTASGLKGQGIGFDLPDVELRDVGKRQGGVTASEAASQVAAALQSRIAQKVLTNVEALRRGGLEGAVDALKGMLR